jgi:hypothetical protein
MERDRRGDIHQHAGSPAGRRLEGLIGRTCGRAVGVIEQSFDCLHAAAGVCQGRLRQQQPGAGPDQISGHRRKPPLNRRRFAAQVVDRVEVPLYQPGGPDHLPRGHRVPYRVVGQPMLLAPGRRVAVQLRRLAGLVLQQAGAEQVGEQLVVAPPATHLIQRDQEQARPLQPFQHRLAAGPAGDGVAQRSRQPLQDRRLQQKAADLIRLALQHFLGQIVKDVAVAAREGRHEPGHIGVLPKRQAGQLQPGHPPLGAGRQRRHSGLRQGGPGRLAQQRRRLLDGEAQLGGAQLGQLPAPPQPRQPQRRVSPAGQHQPQDRRPVLQQESERGVHRLGVDQLVVVQDQQHLARTGLAGQLVDQGRHQPLEGRRGRRAEQRGELPGDPGTHLVQRGHHMAPEPRRVVVASVQRQPGDRPPALPGPVGQQSGLAEPGRSADQHQPPRQPLVESPGQPWAGQEARLQAWQVQLGGQQPIRSAGARRPEGRCGRISHRALP